MAWPLSNPLLASTVDLFRDNPRNVIRQTAASSSSESLNLQVRDVWNAFQIDGHPMQLFRWDRRHPIPERNIPIRVSTTDNTHLNSRA